MISDGDTAFDRLNLRNWAPDQDEPAGENEKSWFRYSVDSKHRWVWKPNRPNRSEHEDRSELIASMLAMELGVPAAEIRLAELGGIRGCISKNVVTAEGHQLEHASVFLTEFVSDFDARARDARGHSIHWIYEILRQIKPPILMAAAGLRAIDCFAGYLIFDALIGNTDRHSENWAIEITTTGSMHLAPSYDHATSLGVTTRGRRLDSLIAHPSEIPNFVTRATAHRFEGHAKTSLVDFAALFLDRCGGEARAYWRGKIEDLDTDRALAIVAACKMSAPATTLATSIVQTNKERLLQCLKS